MAVLNRKMFSRGGFAHRGTGITTGLATPKRGYVDGPGSYAGKDDDILAKEILFGLDDNENEMKEDNSLIKEIVKETQATEVEENIRDTINRDFAGEKSTINDETKFMSEDELNKAIQETANKDKNKNEKKKKRFFFF